jgi:copper(I)-binding protein
MKRLIVALSIALGFMAPGSASMADSSNITIQRAWARATPNGATVGVVYMTLVNKGMADDRLLSAMTPIAQKVQFHSATNENGVMQMRELSSITIHPGSLVSLKPGAMHMMMIGLKQALKEGQTFPLALDFEKAGQIDVTVLIESIGAMTPNGMDTP